VSLLGLDGARAEAQQLLGEALAALDRSALARTGALRALASMVVERDR
jgi:farnesyl diphosphate synthase